MLEEILERYSDQPIGRMIASEIRAITPEPKIIQITAGSCRSDHILYALKDDGTIWIQRHAGYPSQRWEKVTP